MFVPVDSMTPQKALLVRFLDFNRAECACVLVLLYMIIPNIVLISVGSLV